MDLIINIFSLVGSLALFLFGMKTMSEGLEKFAGDRLRGILSAMTRNRVMGVLTGVLITALIQSSSATTVMVVSFVNAGLMTLAQSIGVIMGANIGTTVTAWIISAVGFKVNIAAFAIPLLAIGMPLIFSGKSNRKSMGEFVFGFSFLFMGLAFLQEAATAMNIGDMVARMLAHVPQGSFFTIILFVIVGAVVTMIVQASAATMAITLMLFGMNIPGFGFEQAAALAMGQNIGTCVTAMLSSIGTNRSARRAAVVHLAFNIIGTAVWLTIFELLRALVDIPLLSGNIDQLGIAIVHSVFNVLCTVLLLPMASFLERLACRIIPDHTGNDSVPELDERLMATPSVAMERCHEVTMNMGLTAVRATRNAMRELRKHEDKRAESIREDEQIADRYEDELGTYLVKLSGCPLSDQDRVEAAELLHMIGDFERISDHAVNILEATEELRSKGMSFTPAAMEEMSKMFGAVDEILDLALTAFIHADLTAAREVEPLEQVVDTLKEQLRSRHILRLQEGKCSMEAGFVWADLLTDLERIADHCSNIAGCVVQMQKSRLDIHGYLDSVRTGSEEYRQRYNFYARKYALV